jgi:hypothetical protein
MTALDVKPHPTETAPPTARPWKITSLVLGIAVVALALTLMAATGVFGGQSDAEALAADFHDAWETLDGEAVAAFFTDYGSIVNAEERMSRVGEEIPAYVDALPGDSVLTFGDSVSVGNFVAAPYELDHGGEGTVNATGISVVEVVGDQIAHQYLFDQFR